MWVQSECFTLKDSKENNRSHHFFIGKARIGGLGYRGVLENFTLYSYTVGLFKRCIYYFFNLKIYLQQKGIRPTEEAKRVIIAYINAERNAKAGHQRASSKPGLWSRTRGVRIHPSRLPSAAPQESSRTALLPRFRHMPHKGPESTHFKALC